MSLISSVGHRIASRSIANDEFYTPIELVSDLLAITPLSSGDTVLESAFGSGNFFNNFPAFTVNSYSTDFFNEFGMYDWIVTNPPYSKLNDWFEHTCKHSIKGFALLIGMNNLTTKRLELVESYGFGLTKVVMFKVYQWFGMSAYCIFERNKKSIIDYKRKIYGYLG
jgi:hypothetical protein